MYIPLRKRKTGTENNENGFIKYITWTGKIHTDVKDIYVCEEYVVEKVSALKKKLSRQYGVLGKHISYDLFIYQQLDVPTQYMF